MELTFELDAADDVELTDDQGNVWYNIDGEAHKVVVNGHDTGDDDLTWSNESLKPIGEYTIEIDQDAWAAQSEDARKAAAGTYVVTVSSSTIVLLADGNDEGTTVDATEEATEAQLTFYVEVTAAGNVSILSTDLGGAFTLNQGVLTGKFAVRGSDQSATLEAAAHNADGFTVTVGAKQ